METQIKLWPNGKTKSIKVPTAYSDISKSLGTELSKDSKLPKSRIMYFSFDGRLKCTNECGYKQFYNRYGIVNKRIYTNGVIELIEPVSGNSARITRGSHVELFGAYAHLDSRLTSRVARYKV